MIHKNFTGLILFTAPWASGPCQSALQILETALSRDNSANLPLEIIQESPETDSDFDLMRIEAVPCLIRMRAGREEGRVVGAESKEILALISGLTKKQEDDSSITSVSAISSNTNADASVDANDDLKTLVRRSRLMLFIKGTPSEPRCGFTSQLIKLLSQNGLHPSTHYSTFDILSDDRVRAALKEWAQWPTYPQIYWKGELMGGLDILKEMFANGQMDEIMKELLKK